MMVRFGAVENVARAAVQQVVGPGGTPAPERARLVKAADGTDVLEVDENFDRAWRRVGLALDRIGFTVVDRDRSTGVYFVRYGDPDTAKVDPGWLSKLQFWKDTTEKPEQYRIVVTGGEPRSKVTVQDPAGAAVKSANSEKMLSLIRDQLK
jgi:outer membrane protein assembly factor BamC